MNITKNLLLATGLAGSLLIGSASVALAGDGDGDATPGAGRTARITAICAHSDQLVAKLTDRQARLTARTATLVERRDAATAAGHDAVASRLDQRITHLQTASTKVAHHLQAAPDWIAAHCS